MALANLYTYPINADEMAMWSFANMAGHRDIIRAIADQYGERLDEYVLDPFDRDNVENWTYLHALMHQQMNEVLGIAGYNLNEVDWDDRESLASWWTQHADEHYRASRALGLE